MPKIMVSLRSIFYFKFDRSTQSFDPVIRPCRSTQRLSTGGSRREALDGLNSSTIGILAHFSH
jgi:hypothetical protein